MANFNICLSFFNLKSADCFDRSVMSGEICVRTAFCSLRQVGEGFFVGRVFFPADFFYFRTWCVRCKCLFVEMVSHRPAMLSSGGGSNEKS